VTCGSNLWSAVVVPIPAFGWFVTAVLPHPRAIVHGVAGYSGTPLPKKLGIKDGSTLALIGAPPDVIDELPAGVTVTREARGRADVVVAFFVRRIDFERRIAGLGKMIFPAGGLWIAWPKRASGIETTMTEDVVRAVALPLGLVDNKVCAIDDTWSGLRIVWRIERRK
jgi:hypothetical protein